MPYIKPCPDETLDQLAGADLKIIQKKDGHRVTHDALFLADFIVHSGARGRVVDLGTGNGIVSLLLAAYPQIDEVVGLEVQPQLVELARRNAALNGFENKIRICQGDWCQIREVLKGEKFDIVVANPPYWKVDAGRINPGTKRANARHELTGELEQLISACRYLVRPYKGCVNLIYPVKRLVELIGVLEKYQLQPKQLQFIHSNVKTQAKFFMLRATLHGQQGVQVLAPVILPASPDCP